MSRMLLAAVLVVLLLGASVSRAADPSDGTAAATPDVKVAVQQLLEDAKSHLAASKYNEALDCYDQASGAALTILLHFIFAYFKLATLVYRKGQQKLYDLFPPCCYVSYAWSYEQCTQGL
jgi:hypothetical protein